MHFCKLPCARPKPAYRQTAYPIRRWTGTGHPTYDPPSDPRWKAIPVCRSHSNNPPAPVYVPTPVPVYVPTPVQCKIEPVYPCLWPNFNLFNPPTRTTLPRYYFPTVSQPQPDPSPHPPSSSPPPPPYPGPPQYPPPPFPRNTGGTTELHPMLALREGGPNIQWLLFDHPFRRITWDVDCSLHEEGRNQVRLYQEAACPSGDVKRIQISYTKHSRDLVEISIPRKVAHLPLTVAEVLEGIFSHFMAPLSQEDLQTLSKNQEEQNSACGANYRRTHRRPGSGKSEPIKRVDTLGDRTRFGGLRVHEVRDGTLFLYLDLLPGQANS